MTQYDATDAAAGLATFPMTTAFDFPEYQLQRTLGSCFGLVVRSMGAMRGIGASFKALAGGEVSQYTRLLEDSRRHAMDRLVDNARLMGANAIIGMRFDSSEIGNSLTEIAAYGTAVVIGPLPAG
ncbi:MAG: YbjQ family protein [Acidimicrobiales bacterium]